MSARGVEQINIRRRAVYTDLAAKKGVSVTEIAGATACQILDSVGRGNSTEMWAALGVSAAAR